MRRKIVGLLFIMLVAVEQAMAQSPIPFSSCFTSFDKMMETYNPLLPYYSPTIGPTRPKNPPRGYLYDLKGTKFGFSERYRRSDQLLIVGFWQPNCPDCDRLMSDLSVLRALRPDPKLVIMIMSDHKAALPKVAQNLPFYVDPKGQVQWQVRDWLSGKNPPPFFVLIHDGSVVGHGKPGIDWREEAAQRVIDGEVCRYLSIASPPSP